MIIYDCIFLKLMYNGRLYKVINTELDNSSPIIDQFLNILKRNKITKYRFTDKAKIKN